MQLPTQYLPAVYLISTSKLCPMLHRGSVRPLLQSHTFLVNGISIVWGLRHKIGIILASSHPIKSIRNSFQLHVCYISCTQSLLNPPYYCSSSSHSNLLPEFMQQTAQWSPLSCSAPCHFYSYLIQCYLTT